MFTRAEVREQLERFVRVRLFTDGTTDRHRRQQALELERFNTVALPLYAIVDSLGASRGVFLGMTRDTREFVRFLDEGTIEAQSTLAGDAAANLVIENVLPPTQLRPDSR